MAHELIFETRKLCKHFGPTVALDNVDLQIFRGQVTGLIGENGSGKSTLSSIVAGIQLATSGEMFYLGEPYEPKTMLSAQKRGIGMVVQEQGTISGITVAENLFLGQEQRFHRLGMISSSRMNKAAKEILRTIGFDHIDPSERIDRFNMQDRKLFEVAKVMHNQPELLIVDESTTALSQRGRQIIYDIMAKMRQDNKAVIFISHDLDEMITHCDRLTVLRDGVLTATLEQADMTEANIKRSMVGREMKGEYYRSDFGTPVSDEVVLKVDTITTGTGLLTNFSLEAHKGEILGIGGLSDCGMHELGKAIFGEEKIVKGSVLHVKSGATVVHPHQAVELGFGYVSKDRDQEALVLSATIQDNILSAGLKRVANSFNFIQKKKKLDYVTRQVTNLKIKCASIEQEVQYLSGGNKQKVVFGKWVGRDCDILILDCPTRGVDIGVKAAMYQLMNDMRKAGKTLIMISEELSELIGMSDRIIIIKDGEKSGEFSRNERLTEHTIIDSMI